MLRLFLALLILVTSTMPVPARGRVVQDFRTQGSEWATVSGALVVAQPTKVGQVVNMFDEVNEQRRRAGKPAFLPCPGLQAAAEACAAYRAKIHAPGHVDDFAFVPKGYTATCAGAACWPPSYGLGGCNRMGNEKYAGAASCMGDDGQVYHHLYYR